MSITSPDQIRSSLAAHARAIFFIVLMYLVMAVMGLVCLPAAAVSRRAAVWSVRSYAWVTLELLRLICGTRYEIRGEIPTGPCLVASKHQSFLDVLMLLRALRKPRFVMKRSLLWVPVLGLYAMRIGGVAIDRTKRGEALQAMIGALERDGGTGQLVVFPQGTRLAPNVKAPYRAGIAVLYGQFQLPVALAGANTGWFWPRVGTRRTAGIAVLEFIGSLPTGLSQPDLMREIEDQIETVSDRLSAEAIAQLSTCSTHQASVNARSANTRTGFKR